MFNYQQTLLSIVFLCILEKICIKKIDSIIINNKSAE